MSILANPAPPLQNIERKPAGWWSLLVVVTLAILTTAAYLPGLGGGFMFDDYPNIADNPQIQPREASLASLSAAAMSSPSSELKRPLASLTFAANVLADGGLSPESMKATNIAIHVANGILLYFLLLTLFRFRPLIRIGEPSAIVLAGLAALTWLLLPINLTAVLYIVQRMESLANLFVLAGLLGYMRARIQMQAGENRLIHAMAWAVLPALLGLAAKETSILLPLYTLCLEASIFRFRSKGPIGTVDRRIAGFYLLALGAPLTAGALFLGPHLLQPAAWATRDFTLYSRLLSEARVVLDYLFWTIFPSPTDLSFYHDEFVPSSGWLDPISTLISSITLLLVLLALWHVRKTLPLVSLGGSWFFACHTLTATVLPLELIYEHRNYFASIGVVLALVGLLQYLTTQIRLAGPRYRLLLVVPILLGGALAIRSAAFTATTAKSWATPLLVAETLGARGPDSPRAQYELGRAYLIASHYDPNSPMVAKATAALEGAARIPDSPVLAEQALIFMNGRIGQPEKVIWWESMRHKLAFRPVTVQDDSALVTLASCAEQGACHIDTQQLDRTFKVALSKPISSPRLKSSYSDFATRILRNNELALDMMRRASIQAPNEPVYHVSLARMLLAKGDFSGARIQRDALTKLNIGGRLDHDIEALDHSLITPRRIGSD